jgi:hypothetical protein
VTPVGGSEDPCWSAELFLDGAAHGQTPLSEDFTCSDGQKVSLEVRLKGFTSPRFPLGCVRGTTEVLAELKARK